MMFKDRFRGYLPVVLDIETGGFDAQSNPLLELACTFLEWEQEVLQPGTTYLWNVLPFAGSVIEPASLKVTGIDVTSPDRNAQDEKVVLVGFFKEVRARMKLAGCHRAVIVAHNAAFDAGFISGVCTRQAIKRNPFHPFTTVDTAALGAVAYGHTVLQELCRRAGIAFDQSRAHSAAYDAERTAELFCAIVNGWPIDTSTWTE